MGTDGTGEIWGRGSMGSIPAVPQISGFFQNPVTHYSQSAGREELFDREREVDPDLSLWDDSVRACAEVAF